MRMYGLPCRAAFVALATTAIILAGCAGTPSPKAIEPKASPEERLFRAADRADRDEVSELLATGASPNFAMNGKTTLHAAAERESPANASIVGLLLAAGADPAALDDKGQTPLERYLARAKFAANLYPEVDDATVLSFDLNRLYAAKPLRKDPFGANGTAEILAAVDVLARGVYGEFAKASLLPWDGPALESALLAALEGDGECACVDMIRRAYAAGRPIPKATLDAVLAKAIVRGKPVAILDLLSRGAKPRAPEDGADYVAKLALDMSEKSTFVRRVFVYECVRDLAAAGLKPFSPEGPAAAYKRVDDAALPGNQNVYAQRLAIETTRLYVAAGADPNGLVKGSFYDTPLIHKVLGDYLQNPFINNAPEQYDSIRTLLAAIVKAKGVDLNAPYLYDESNGLNWKGCTPLEYAFAREDKRAPDAVELLLAAGADAKKLVASEAIAARVGARGDVDRANRLFSLGMPARGPATDAMIVAALSQVNNRTYRMKDCKALVNLIETKRGNAAPF